MKLLLIAAACMGIASGTCDAGQGQRSAEQYMLIYHKAGDTRIEFPFRTFDLCVARGNEVGGPMFRCKMNGAP